MRSPAPTAPELLAAESQRFPLVGRRRAVLLFPNRYAVAMSSLGFQAVWARLDGLPDTLCERAFLPDDEAAPVRSLETGSPLSQFDLVAVSISDELDLPNVARALARGGLPPLVDERSDGAPVVIAGGPLTQSDPGPLGVFADAVLCGDAEGVLEPLAEAALETRNRRAFAEQAAALNESQGGVWAPAVHGDELPPLRRTSADTLPAWSRVWTPHSALPDMFLVEVSRGCPRSCTFCLSRRRCRPETRADGEAVWRRVPAEAPRVGFVGSAVSDHPAIRDLVARAVDRGQGVGVSSLRADRLDDELVGLLVRGGLRTMTVGADALSERLRRSVKKGVTADHLRHAAETARRHGLGSVKLYTLFGLPDETDDDVAEWVALCDELRRHARVVVALNPFVPKRGTPLADAEPAPLPVLKKRLRLLTKELGRRRIELRALSPRWAWVQWKLSHGGRAAGLAAAQVAETPGKFSDWKRAFARNLSGA